MHNDPILDAKYQRLRDTYGERNSDIYVSTYSRSGTTWTQVILYVLTTGRDIEFDHIFDVSPWLYYSALRNTQPANVPDPRILKTHDEHSLYTENTKGRFIYVTRNGLDVLESLFHHKINAKGYSGSFEEHFDEFINGDNYNWFDHVRGWHENKNNLNILYVYYEDLIYDLDKQLDRIAQFCNIDINPTLKAKVKTVSSFENMKAQQLRLGPDSRHFSSDTKTPYKVKSQNHFVRSGRIGEGLERINERQFQTYSEKFRDAFGHLESMERYHYSKKQKAQQLKYKIT